MYRIRKLEKCKRKSCLADISAAVKVQWSVENDFDYSKAPVVLDLLHYTKQFLCLRSFTLRSPLYQKHRFSCMHILSPAIHPTAKCTQAMAPFITLKSYIQIIIRFVKDLLKGLFWISEKLISKSLLSIELFLCPQEDSNLCTGIRNPALYPPELWGRIQSFKL